MSKKKVILLILITICIIISTFFTVYITKTNAIGPFSLGSRYYLGQNNAGGSITNGGYNLMTMTNRNFFCGHSGVWFATTSQYGTGLSYKNVAKITITGNKATGSAIQNYKTTNSVNLNTITSDYNKALALLFYKVKGDTVTVNKDGSYSGIADVGTEWEKTYTGNYSAGTYPRTRSCKSDEGFHYDIGQAAIWKGLIEWRTKVAQPMDNKESVWTGVASYIQGTTNVETYVAQWSTGEYEACVREQIKTLAMGYSVWDDIWNEAKAIVSEDYEGYGIEEAYYNDSSSNKQVATQVQSGDYTILGPFKYNFVGSLEDNKPVLTFDSNKTSRDYTIGTYTGSVFSATNKVVSGNSFYIKVANSLLNGVEKINLEFQVAGINWADTTTTLQFFDREMYDSNGNIIRNYQPMIYFDQTEAKYTLYVDTYKISKPVTISLEKTNASGEKIAVEGITFQVKDSANKVVGTITTDSNGNGKSTVQVMTNQTYTLVETTNPAYGYKKIKLSKSDITLSNAEITQDRNNIKFKLNNSTSSTATLKVKNNKELANLTIEKTGENGESLYGVGFKVQIKQGTSIKYLQLKDSSGNVVSQISGSTVSAIINSDNKSKTGEYQVEYITDIKNATQFRTGYDGKISIQNLEVNASASAKYSYKVYEVYNDKYGYGSSANASIVKDAETLTAGQTKTLKIENKQDLGNLELTKYDKVTEEHKILLSNVGFAVQVTSTGYEGYRYLQVYDVNGELVKNITGEVTINKGNIATKDGKEYRLAYMNSIKEYSELTNKEKREITVFKTGTDGKIKINNLEVYRSGSGEKYTYKLIETSNGNYGYEIDSVELGDIQLETDKPVNKELNNIQKYIKISGYVWEEKPNQTKSNTYDSVYTENDKILKDLYTPNAPDKWNPYNTITNTSAEIPVTIGLHNIKTGTTVPPNSFDMWDTGKYTFSNVEVSELENYEIVFTYNGFKYTTVALTDVLAANSSKVKENVEQRKELNSQFESVEKAESGKHQVVGVNRDENEKPYQMYYRADMVQDETSGATYQVSSIENLTVPTNVKATTTDAGTNLNTIYNDLRINSTTAIDTIDNINMGIVLREQPKLALGSDIHSVSVEVNGKNYNYYYNGRQAHYEKLNNDEVGVKFEQENALRRYTRTVYSSDVEALANNNTTMNVAITYKIKLINQSTTLTSVVKEITNYYDKNYTIEEVYYLGNDNEKVSIQKDGYWNNQKAEKVKQDKEVITNAYVSTRIKLGDSGIKIEEGQSKDIYIKFSVSQEAIIGLLDGTSTYHNATEIMSYKTLYGENTGKQYLADESRWETYTSELNEKDATYAGIDRVSAPGNIELELKQVNSETEGTYYVLNTEKYEDDTSSSPSLILEATEARMVSGTVWEDATEVKDNERLGNGKFDDGENVIQNVKVALHHVSDDGKVGDVAEYSNGEPVVTSTDADGNYTLGYKAADGTYVGIIPGDYVMVYTYNNESIITGKQNINVNDYKSTLITSQVIKDAFEKTEESDGRWYVKEGARYSNARDDINLRPEYENPNVEVINANYNTLVTDMDAHTPIMNIGIEFTELNEANETFEEQTIQNADGTTEKVITNIDNRLTNGTMIYKLNYVDFGICERPYVDIEIEKEITGLEIIAQNGTAIIPKGDPTDLNSRMQYVKKLAGIVSAEIEASLLQGAQLNLEYTITIIDNSENDYLNSDYYYYGENKVNLIERRASKVIDYMDDTLKFDSVNNVEGIWSIKTAEELKEAGLVTESVYKTLKAGNYTILMTEELTTSDEVKLYATKALAISTEINEKNRVEIIELTGGRTIKDTEPGNYDPSGEINDNFTYDPEEKDSSRITLIITGPTGTTINYILYAIAGIATLAILVVGILIIKKKIIK